MQCRVTVAKPRNGLVVSSAFLSASALVLILWLAGTNLAGGMGPQLAQL